jgi:hypothetical protein
VNLSEAIELLGAVSAFHFKASEEKPNFCIFDNQNEGYSLSVKAHLISSEYHCHLREVAKSHKLVIRESEGLFNIQSY